MDTSNDITMNVTDLRRGLRRSVANRPYASGGADRRKAADRRQVESAGQAVGNASRIWLTPGERTLIEDLYLLDDN